MGELPGRCHLPANTSSVVNFLFENLSAMPKPSFLGVGI